jgi:hypothetical protein
MEQNAEIYSDMYKDAYGFRPRSNFPETEEEYSEAFGRLQREISEQIEAERAYEEKAIKEFEESISAMMASGAPDRATALRWFSQNYTMENPQDVDFMVYELGFLFTDYGRELVKEISSLVF